jgi:hypothetical protein
MEKYISFAKKALLILTKIIFVIAMITTVLAAFATFGSLIRIEIDFRDDAVPLLGLSVYSWFSFFMLQEKKNRKPSLKNFFYDIVPFFAIILIGFIITLFTGNLFFIVIFYIILLCFLLKVSYAYCKFKRNNI